MIRFFFTLVILCTWLVAPFCQNLEAGISIGAINYQGDLADDFIQMRETHPAYGVHIRHYIDDRFALRLNYWYGNISGSDGNSNSITLRFRDYSFESSLQEVTAQCEFNLRRFFFKKSTDFKMRFIPFVSLGAGVTFVPGIPKAPVNAIEDPFPEIGDKSNFFCLPVSVGTRLFLTKQFLLTVELGSRTVFSDFLDGVSQKGNPNKSDWYIIGAVSVSYFFNSDTFECGGW